MSSSDNENIGNLLNITLENILGTDVLTLEGDVRRMYE